MQAAYNLCRDGDTLAIPAGNVAWSGPLYITNGIRVMGTGTDNTVIRTVGRMFEVSRVRDPQTLRISGIRNINQNVPPGYAILVIGHDVDTNAPIHNLRIDHCRFEHAYMCITLIGCNVRGVIDHNTFYDCSGNGGGAIQLNGGWPVWQYLERRPDAGDHGELPSSSGWRHQRHRNLQWRGRRNRCGCGRGG